MYEYVSSFDVLCHSAPYLACAPGMQVEGLMHELLLCVGLFTVLETRNQDVLLWGKVPTPVHKLCTLLKSLPEQPSVASSLRYTLLAVCIPNQPVCEVMILQMHGSSHSFLYSCTLVC